MSDTENGTITIESFFQETSNYENPEGVKIRVSAMVAQKIIQYRMQLIGCDPQDKVKLVFKISNDDVQYFGGGNDLVSLPEIVISGEGFMFQALSGEEVLYSSIFFFEGDAEYPDLMTKLKAIGGKNAVRD